MALSKGICHSILLTGNLKDSNKLILKLPFEDISSNLWQISLSQISINFKQAANIICGISCNFVHDIKFNTLNQISNCYPILWQCLLKGRLGENQVQNYDRTWFYITSVKDEIILEFHLYLNGVVSQNAINLNCDLYITLLLQRVK